MANSDRAGLRKTLRQQRRALSAAERQDKAEDSESTSMDKIRTLQDKIELALQNSRQIEI